MSTDTTLSRARALIEAAEKATAGKWVVAVDRDAPIAIMSASRPDDVCMFGGPAPLLADTALMVASRNDAPAIAAALVEAVAAMEEIRASVVIATERGVDHEHIARELYRRMQVASAWLAKHGENA